MAFYCVLCSCQIVMTTVTYYGHKGWYGMAANTLLKVMKSSTGPSPIEDEKTLIQVGMSQENCIIAFKM